MAALPFHDDAVHGLVVLRGQDGAIAVEFGRVERGQVLGYLHHPVVRGDRDAGRIAHYLDGEVRTLPDHVQRHLVVERGHPQKLTVVI
ncbi:hypothetical protein ACFQ07_23410 [Actinomadura adrarensis]|uniref:Uncharacterized protein n=1 Tax=Actinomadura adrarensis TaxID=1819600 RepID=A0ABW3CMM7_9ACTN